MFTGIIEEIGTIQKITGGARAFQLKIAAEKVLDGLALGDSVAVSGVCLTVVQFDARSFTADVMPETLRRTVLAECGAGSRVNLERALTLASRLGGHIVSGHVDGVGVIESLAREENAVVVRLRAEPEVARYIVEKGSVALDGASLTVAGCGRDWFSVSLIPHTAAMTTLGQKKPGDRVNIETDVVGKYVERFVSKQGQAQESAKTGLTQAFLQQHGF